MRRFSCLRKAISSTLEVTGMLYRKHPNRRIQSSENFRNVKSELQGEDGLGCTYNCKEEGVTKKMKSLAAASTIWGDVLGSTLPLLGPALCSDRREGRDCIALDPGQFHLGPRSVHFDLNPFPLRW